jgi:hypothetical protein
MSDMLQTWVMLKTGVLLLLLLHHLLVVIHTGCTSRVSCILLSALVVLIIVASLVGEILRAFVFVCGAILFRRQHSSVNIQDHTRHSHIGTLLSSRLCRPTSTRTASCCGRK